MGNMSMSLLDGFAERFKVNQERILLAAEECIFGECCSNGCAHKASGSFAGGAVERPAMCAHFVVSTGTGPVECEAFEGGE